MGGPASSAWGSREQRGEKDVGKERERGEVRGEGGGHGVGGMFETGVAGREQVCVQYSAYFYLS